MQKLIFNTGLCFLFLLLSSFECSKKSTTPPLAAIQASAYAPGTPILKGLTANPALRVAVSIPSGNSEQQYRKIICTLNAEAISNI